MQTVIGSRVRLTRNKMNLTQSKFAKRIGISTSYLAEIETGVKSVNTRIIKLVSSEFNIDEHWLQTGEGEMFGGDADVLLANAISLFKTLSPQFQSYVISQLEGLCNLQSQICVKI